VVAEKNQLSSSIPSVPVTLSRQELVFPLAAHTGPILWLETVGGHQQHAVVFHHHSNVVPVVSVKKDITAREGVCRRSGSDSGMFAAQFPLCLDVLVAGCCQRALRSGSIHALMIVTIISFGYRTGCSGPGFTRGA
jgi:hypothetical protein